MKKMVMELNKEQSKSGAIILLSAGLDSSVSLALCANGNEYDVRLALTFNYGQRSAMREIELSRKLCSQFGVRHKVIELPWLAETMMSSLVNKEKTVPRVLPQSVDDNAQSNAKNVWVPNRNAAFINIAASIAESIGIKNIIVGFNAEEAKTFPDNSPSFIDAANNLLSISTLNGVRLVSPTANMDKIEIAKKFVELDIGADNFWCCYHGEKFLCGQCESCARTIRAFKTAGIWKGIKHRFDVLGGKIGEEVNRYSHKWISKELKYDGTQLRSGWISEMTEIKGDAIVSFVGEVNVPIEHMVDMEDVANDEPIYSKSMLNFISETDGVNLNFAIARQRLLVSIAVDELKKLGAPNYLVRSGDDIYDGDRKLSVSIATISSHSSLIHFAMNIISDGTPIPTVGLGEYEIEPELLAKNIMNRYVDEMAEINWASIKIRPVK